MELSHSEPTISVVIPVHNAGEDLRRALQGLAGSETAPFEVIVVADGESDGSWRMAEGTGARIVRLPESRGPARARNLGAAQATGEVLLFVDSDVVVSPDAIPRVMEAFRRDPELAALFGSYDEAPLATNFLSQYKNLFHHYVHQAASEDASTFWSGCGAVRRRVFQELGGFNEGYRRPSIEDIEFGYRLKRGGYRIRLHKGVKVKHLKRWGLYSLLRADVLYRAVPWSMLILAEGRMMNDLNLKTASRVSVVAVHLLLVALLLAPFWPLFLLPAFCCALVLLVLNWDLYRFFNARRGLLFAVGTVPWNWFYFLYSGLAFAYSFAAYRLARWEACEKPR